LRKGGGLTACNAGAPEGGERAISTLCEKNNRRFKTGEEEKRDQRRGRGKL